MTNIQHNLVHRIESKKRSLSSNKLKQRDPFDDFDKSRENFESPASSIDYSAALSFGVFEDPRAESSVETFEVHSKFLNPADINSTRIREAINHETEEEEVYKKLERAFRIECLHANMKKHIKRQEREMIKLRGQLIKLRTRDAIMQTKMNDTNEQLQSQTMRYNSLCQEIQQVVSMAACVSVVPVKQASLSPERPTRYSFSATMEDATTPKLPTLSQDDESYESPIESPTPKESHDDENCISPFKGSTLTSAISIPTRKFGMESPDVPLTPNVRIVGGLKIKKENVMDVDMPPPPLPNQQVRFAASEANYEAESHGGFSYVDAMKMLMSPNTIPEQSFVQKTINIYGTTPLTNEQNDFKTIIAKAEVNNMNKKINVIKKMYEQENNELKRRMEVLEGHLSDKDAEVLRLKEELAQAHETIREQNRVLKSTKTVMSAFCYDGSISSGTDDSTPKGGKYGLVGSFAHQRRFSGKKMDVLSECRGNVVTRSNESSASSVSPASTSVSNIVGRNRRSRRSFYSKIGVL